MSFPDNFNIKNQFLDLLILLNTLQRDGKKRPDEVVYSGSVNIPLLCCFQVFIRCFPGRNDYGLWITDSGLKNNLNHQFPISERNLILISLISSSSNSLPSSLIASSNESDSASSLKNEKYRADVPHRLPGNIVIEIDTGSRIHDGFNFRKQFRHLQSFGIGNILEGSFHINALNDINFNTRFIDNRFDHHIERSDYFFFFDIFFYDSIKSSPYRCAFTRADSEIF